MIRLFTLLVMLFAGVAHAEFDGSKLSDYRVNNGANMKRCTAESYADGRCFEVAENGPLVILAFELGKCKTKRPEDHGYVLVNTHSKLVTPLNITGEHCGEMPVPQFGEVEDGSGGKEPVISFFANNTLIQTFYLN